MPSYSFWYWLGLLIVALVVLRFVPDRARGWLIVILILGGLYNIQRQQGGLNSFFSDLTNGKFQYKETTA